MGERLIAWSLVALTLAGCQLGRGAPSAQSNSLALPIVFAGTYYVPSWFHAGSCIDIGSENVSKSDDNLHRFTCNAQVYQRWKISPDPARPGRYLIEWAGAEGKFWTAEDFDPNASYVTFDRRRDNSFQAWTIVDIKDHVVVTFKNDGNGKCIDYNIDVSWPPGSGDPNKQNLRLSPCNGSKQQQWALQRVQ